MFFLRKRIILAFLLISASLVGKLSYSVKFSGLEEDPETLSILKKSSTLLNMKNTPPRSINALHFRADEDITSLQKVLKSFGYYDARIQSSIFENEKKATVLLIISPGVRYQLKTYHIFQKTEKSQSPYCFCENFPLKDIDIQLNVPITNEKIATTRLKILYYYASNGYPLAQIDKQDVLADVSSKTVHIKVYVDKGPKCEFGTVSILGIQNIKPEFIDKKIQWKEGETYSTNLIEKSQQKLLKSNLFSSVMISHGGKLTPEGELPIKIHVVESKHRNINLGFSYATVDGPGVSFGWANQNIGQTGQLLSLQGNIAEKSHTGVLTYKKPDFYVEDQTYAFQLLALREKIFPYNSQSYQAVTRIERKASNHFIYMIGVQAEKTTITESANNGRYILFGMPVTLKYSTANNLMNPTEGWTINYFTTPYVDSENSSFFLQQKLLGETYFTYLKSKRLTLAFRMEGESVAGSPRDDIPLTKLSLGGSDVDLRGYKFKSVSPLSPDKKPYGGRSAIFGSFEPRIMMTDTIGFVPFFDIGTVSNKQFPTIFKKWYKSTGFGFRYFSFFGPIRFDIGFPLDRRSVDPAFRIYVSIGQTF
ncbi:MAG TPA: BamA/TamA family outer membrane protein [Chlamydiales bacterium]|nr:BamA/TamA family outer membrane protein [Chlamydiales bacterium]